MKEEGEGGRTNREGYRRGRAVDGMNVVSSVRDDEVRKKRVGLVDVGALKILLE